MGVNSNCRGTFVEGRFEPGGAVIYAGCKYSPHPYLRRLQVQPAPLEPEDAKTD